MLPLKYCIKLVLSSCWKHTDQDVLIQVKSFPLFYTSKRKLEKIILKFKTGNYGVLTQRALYHSRWHLFPTLLQRELVKLLIIKLAPYHRGIHPASDGWSATECAQSCHEQSSVSCRTQKQTLDSGRTSFSWSVGASQRRPAPHGRHYSTSLQHTDPWATPHTLRPTKAMQSYSSADWPRVSLWTRLRQTQRPWHVCSPVPCLLERTGEPSPPFVTGKTNSGVFEHLRTSLVLWNILWIPINWKIRMLLMLRMYTWIHSIT